MQGPQQKKIQIIAEYFVKQQLTLGFAESCTGGKLSSRFVAAAGASQYFTGSIVCYDRKIKQQLLGVSLPLMQVMGEVSIPVAEAMAVGVRRVLGVTWGLSITGIAGPTGGTVEKPVGTVCFALSGPGHRQVFNKSFSPTASRSEIQDMAVEFAIDVLFSVCQP